MIPLRLAEGRLRVNRGDTFRPGIWDESVRILIADDSYTARRHLRALVAEWGYFSIEAANGEEAWQLLQADPPLLAILDWVMPGLDGLQLTRRIRESGAFKNLHIIMLTGMTESEQIVAGLNAGANDFITKPFKEAELQARVNVGARMVQLQLDLAKRVQELESAMAEISQLRGFLPICAYCKSVRNDDNYWQSVESYVAKHSHVKFSHGVCPHCLETRVLPELERLGTNDRTAE